MEKRDQSQLFSGRVRHPARTLDRVLVHLWIEDGQNQKTLCEIAGRHKTTITRTIDSLEEMNYVVRIPDQADKRHKLIYLTHKGKAEKEALIAQMLKTIAEATEGITPGRHRSV